MSLGREQTPLTGWMTLPGGRPPPAGFAGDLPTRWGGEFLLRLFFVAQDWAEPAFCFCDRHVLAAGVVLDLVAADLPDHEVARLRVGEVEAGHGGGRRHGSGLGEVHADRTRAEQIEQLVLLRVVRARRIAEGRADAAVLLADQLL